MLGVLNFAHVGLVLSRMAKAMRSIMAWVLSLQHGAICITDDASPNVAPRKTKRLLREQARKLSQVRPLRQSRRLIGEEHHEQEHCDCVHGLSESSSGPDEQFDGLTRAVVRLYNATTGARQIRLPQPG